LEWYKVSVEDCLYKSKRHVPVLWKLKKNGCKRVSITTLNLHLLGRVIRLVEWEGIEDNLIHST
jgi:hypothetical protein